MRKVRCGMTPRKAILDECRFCLNASRQVKCESKVCPLNDGAMTPLRRIKAHCLTCAPEQSRQGVQSCTGMIIGSQPRVCLLHPYRHGHNPKRAGIGFSRKQPAQVTIAASG